MTIRNYYGVSGYLTSSVDATTPIMLVDSTLSGAIAATFVNGVDGAFFALRTAGTYEVVRVTSITGNAITVLRGEASTTPAAFPTGTIVEYVLTPEAVVDAVGSLPSAITVVGDGGIEIVTEYTPGIFSIEVPSPTFTGTNGVEITGSWPNISFAYVAPENPCCAAGAGGAGGTGIQTAVFYGIASGYVGGTELTVNVGTPTFSGSGGITVTGTWPYYTISYAGGGSGSVTSVAATAGLYLTGSPTVNPTLGISSTGVTAGIYGDVDVNVRGQLTRVAVGFNPVSAIVSTDSTIAVVRTGSSVSLDVAPAAVGVAGVAPLADETDPFNSADNTSIATPAVVALALSSLVLPEGTGVSVYLGEADGGYTNTITASSTAIVLLAGEKAIVYAECTMLDPSLPTTPVLFGLSVFTAVPAKIQSNRKIPQCTQNMSFILTGPINTSLLIATTAIPAGASVMSSSLWILKI